MENRFDITKFDAYREDNRLEVKKAKDKLPDAMWETYSSFANTSGGCIILGVREREDKSWETTGLKDVMKLRKAFFDTLHNQSKVNASLVNDSGVRIMRLTAMSFLLSRFPRQEGKTDLYSLTVTCGTEHTGGTEKGITAVQEKQSWPCSVTRQKIHRI